MCFTGQCPWECDMGEKCRKPHDIDCWLNSDDADLEKYKERIGDVREDHIDWQEP